MVGLTASAPRSTRVVLHELRGPVTAIIGLAETLSRGAERGEVPQEKLLDRLQRIRGAAERINALLDELASDSE